MTRAKSRLTVLLAFFAVLTMCLGIAFMPKQEAFAAVDTSTGFYVEDGASARLVEGQSGIKWTVHITKTAYNKIVTEKGAVTGAGLEIRPSGTDSEGNEYAWTPFTYGGTLVFGEEETSEYVFPYAIYYDEIINDMNAKLIEQGEDKLTADEEKAYLAQAYAMNLEVRPFVKGLQANGDEYVSYGEAGDTSRSLQGVALAYLLQDIVAEGTKEYNTLVGYIPGTYNEVAEEFKAEETFYSNYDATGVIPIDSAIPMENAKIYYGAKEVTDLYADGAVNLSGVQTKVTTDGTCSDYLTILDTASGDVYKQEFVGVTLAIDEASDLDYFTMKQEMVSYNEDMHLARGRKFAEGDVEWNGYYVLLNDIDCTNYEHDFDKSFKNPSFTSASIAALAAHADTVGKGLVGTFDGRGYTLNGFRHISYGLFGLVNGGTVKNVYINAMNKDVTSYGFSNSGFIASFFVNGATVSNVYIQINGSLNFGWNTPILACQATSDCSIRNLVAYWTGSNQPGGYGGLISSVPAQSVLQDVYFINAYKPVIVGSSSSYAATKNVEGASTTNYNLQKAAADAKYVNGKEMPELNKYYYQAYGSTNIYSLDDYTIGTEVPYAYTRLEGVKRYTSFAKMTEDKANNDFSSWDSSIWEIVDGVPTFRSTLTGDYSAYVNGNAIAGQTITAFAGFSFDVAVEYEGASVGYAPEITAVNGSELVSISGTTVTASSAGTATIKVEYAGASWQFSLNILSAPIALAQEYYFSAHDGQFYDDSFNVVALTDILDKEISAVYDAKANVITVTDGKLMNVDLGKQKDWLETYFVFATADANYKVNVKAADAIIDEATDLSVFTLTSAVTNSIVSPDGEGVFDGYYVMVKSIDATGYAHTFAGTSGFNGRTRTFATVKNDIKEGGIFYEKGFTGRFDGQGYLISNLKFDGVGATAGIGGLFGIINGGIVENVGFVNLNVKEGIQSGAIAQFIVGDAVISDVYISANGDRNDGNNYIIADEVQDTATLERMYILWPDDVSTNPSLALWGPQPLVGVGSAAALKTAMKDSIYISKAPAFVTTDAHTANATIYDSTGATVKSGQRLHRAHTDALYVNGVESETANTFHVAWDLDTIYRTTTYKIQYGTATPYEIGSTYSIGTIPGLRRYTSTTNFINDYANLDFSEWTTDVWAFRTGYAPVFNSTLSGGLVPYINGVDATTSENIVGRGQSVQVIPYRSATLPCVNGAKLSVVSGSEFVKVEGDKIIGLANGEAVIRFEQGAASKTFNITVINPVVPYERDLQFSAADGIFFDGANVVTVADILGENTNYTKITDKAGNVLTLDAETGAISGITTSTKDWEDNAIMFYFEDHVLQVNVRVAELIIDEATDFAHFNVKQAWDYGKTKTNFHTFVEGDFLWTGFYVLAKNIDATGYAHVAQGDASLNAYNQTSLVNHGASQNDHLWNNGLRLNGVWKHGFQGVFDGQGYTISNLDASSGNNGLFGVVSGGTIKNVAFIDCSNGVIAYSVTNNSVIKNIFITNKEGSGGPGGTVLWGSISCTVWQVENVVVYDNQISYSEENVYNWDYNEGSWTNETQRYANNKVATYGSGATVKALSNVIIVSTKPMSQYVAATTQTPVVKQDAKYIDGVENTATYSITWDGADSDASPVEGVRRYTSQDTLTADVANITAQLAQLTETGFFAVDNGVITWVNAPVA
ncbi:MAG: hypothetical protein IKB98_01920 [Clostridia bacterium]|nr:hypothetical protein [Clostridia bacterium]